MGVEWVLIELQGTVLAREGEVLDSLPLGTLNFEVSVSTEVNICASH